MKRILWLVLGVLLLTGCVRKEEKDTATERGQEEKPWYALAGKPNLWRYVDTEYGVVIYVGMDGRITSQRIERKDVGPKP